MNENNVSDDEISLVDLAKIIYRRRKVFYIIFGTVFFIGFMATLFKGEVTTYRSQFQMAEYANEKGEQKPIESTQLVIKKIAEIYYPIVKRNYKKEHNNEKLTHELDIEPKTNFEIFNYVTIISNSKVSEKPLIEAIHKEILDLLSKDQKKLVEKRKEVIAQNIKSLEKAQEDLNSKTNLGSKAEEMKITAINANLNKIGDLEKELNGLREGSILNTMEEEEAKKGRLKIISITLAVGFFMGIMGVFLFEFLSIVKKSIEEEK